MQLSLFAVCVFSVGSSPTGGELCRLSFWLLLGTLSVNVCGFEPHRGWRNDATLSFCCLCVFCGVNVRSERCESFLFGSMRLFWHPWPPTLPPFFGKKMRSVGMKSSWNVNINPNTEKNMGLLCYKVKQQNLHEVLATEWCIKRTGLITCFTWLCSVMSAETKTVVWSVPFFGLRLYLVSPIFLEPYISFGVLSSVKMHIIHNCVYPRGSVRIFLPWCLQSKQIVLWFSYHGLKEHIIYKCLQVYLVCNGSSHCMQKKFELFQLVSVILGSPFLCHISITILSSCLLFLYTCIHHG